ncbi:hypothetical protein G6F42_028677 [Rhizopus arrhizus]|nr:hypothetical protein G6F42_028677 [Rhizopus arrhizus]
MMLSPKSEAGFNLLSALLEYDPAKRITAEKALNHPYFQEDPKPVMNVLAQQGVEYPLRRITQEDNDIKASKQVQPNKDDHSNRMTKKPRNA